MLRKKTSIITVFSNLLIVGWIIFLFNPPNLYAQNKEDKCEDFFVNSAEYYKKYEEYIDLYSTCLKIDFLDNFTAQIIDKFGIVGLDDEWARLDSLATYYNNNSDSQIFIVIYGGKTNKFSELAERPKPLIYYLTENRGIERDKITVVNGGFREKFEFELWVSPSAKIFPPLSPTVDVEKVKFKGIMKPLPVELGN